MGLGLSLPLDITVAPHVGAWIEISSTSTAQRCANVASHVGMYVAGYSEKNHNLTNINNILQTENLKFRSRVTAHRPARHGIFMV